MSDDQPSATPTRQLAAIMFTDVAGYTALMGQDEQKAIRLLEQHREALRALLPQFRGRLLEEVGDGTLSSFQSAVDAVNCAREIQKGAQADPELRVRIGIHIGDVVFSGAKVFGDGVNVASRIHSLADAGGICISEEVYNAVRNQPDLPASFLGEKELKNVNRPVRVYALAISTAAISCGQLGRAEEAPPQRSETRRSRRIAVGAVVVAILGGLALLSWRLLAPRPPSPQPGASRGPIRSLAVLPLENLSGDPNQEYFADGMTDELITDLAKISALRVISRTSAMQFKGEHRKPLPEIAKLLNVDAVVEGSVLRVGDKVRVTAQLIDASTDKHLWAENYERDSRDVLALQDELALAIAREINIELSPEEHARLTTSRTVNPEAYEAALKGLYYFNKWTGAGFKRSVDYFSQAVKADPKFALAYVGLASAYSANSFVPPKAVIPKVREAIQNALQLDDTLAEAHSVLASVKYEYDFDWSGGEAEFRRAIALNPSSALAHEGYGWLLTMQGRFNDAEAELKRASELDPLNLKFVVDVALPFTLRGPWQKAIEADRKALDMDPSFDFAYWVLGRTDINRGRFAEAILEMKKAPDYPDLPFLKAHLGYAYAKLGRRDEALRQIDELRQLAAQRYVSSVDVGIICVGLGDKDRAMELLQKAYDERSSWLTWLKVEPIYDPLRSDPRFQELLKKVGLDH